MGNSFGEGSTFQSDIQAYMKDIVIKEKELKILTKEYEDNKKKWKEIEESPEFQSLGFSHGIFNPQFSHWYTQQDIDNFIATHTPEQVQAAKDFYKYKALTSAAGTAKLIKK